MKVCFIKISQQNTATSRITLLIRLTFLYTSTSGKMIELIWFKTGGCSQTRWVHYGLLNSLLYQTKKTWIISWEKKKRKNGCLSFRREIEKANTQYRLSTPQCQDLQYFSTDMSAAEEYIWRAEAVIVLISMQLNIMNWKTKSLRIMEVWEDNTTSGYFMSKNVQNVQMIAV